MDEEFKQVLLGQPAQWLAKVFEMSMEAYDLQFGVPRPDCGILDSSYQWEPGDTEVEF